MANATGNILENKDLLQSLNNTKEKAATITQSLVESSKLGQDLDKERNDYLPLAQHSSKLFFVISDLSKVNNMYQISLAAFLRLFQRNLERADVSQSIIDDIYNMKSDFVFFISILADCECRSMLFVFLLFLYLFVQRGSPTDRTLSLAKNQLRMAYGYIARSIFKSDRLMFAMHLVHGMFPKKVPTEVSQWNKH